MASQLQKVLDRFAKHDIPRSLKGMARELDIDPGVLDGMIAYWVRKGKLREVSVNGEGCTTCGIKNGCPFVVALPRYFELVREHPTPDPSCGCGGGCVG